MTTTPTKAAFVALLANLGSTPNSTGSGSHHNYATEHGQGNYVSYLKEDLLFEKIIPVDDFFQRILGVHNPTDPTLSNALKSRAKDCDKFQRALADYNWEEVADETDLYAPFVRLANYCLTERAEIQFCRHDPQYIRGSHGRRKPDVIAIVKAALALGDRINADSCSESGPPSEHPFHWLELLSFWEFKLFRRGDIADAASSKTPSSSKSKSKKATSSKQASGSNRQLKPKPAAGSSTKRSSDSTSTSASKRRKFAEDPLTQCASYALELLTYGGLRSHVIGALITNNAMELLYYDRSVIVRSSLFNFIEDTPRFLNLLDDVKRLTKVQWGYHPLLPAPTVKKIIGKGILADPFRGSTIALRSGESVELKDTIFQSHGLIGRGTCVSRATMRPDGNAIILKWSWPAKTRKPEAEFIKHAVGEATGEHSWVVNHLPAVLRSEEREFSANTPQLQLHELFKEEYELRELRIAILEELFPITDLTSAEDLGQAFYGIFLCYQWLYETLGIMHRDVSLNNLMFRKRGDKIYGVLNDFDLAVYWKDLSQSTSKQRTGTKPFMARDLLVLGNPPAHIYRFDLESLFYVMVFVMYHYHEGKEIANPPYKLWEDLGTDALRKEKESLFSNPLPDPTSNFLRLRSMMVSLYRIFMVGYNERTLAIMSREEVKNDTLQGVVDFKAFEDILKDNLPFSC